jgi:2-methylisocitrate lyase-like PEP mutase family enzyme
VAAAVHVVDVRTLNLAARRTSELAAQAGVLRALHVPGTPLVLPNAWDVESARRVEAAAFPALATGSAAVAASLGFEDHERAPVDEMFAAIARMARAVSVPVTADLEAGYGLSGEELVERLLDAGAVGCNIEDTDHRGNGLVDTDVQFERIAGIRAAADRAGVPIVINARVDVFIREVGEPDGRTDEGLRRARGYRDAGADCIYPIMLADEAAIGAFVDAFDGMVNVYARPEAPPLQRLAEVGVARISFGPWIHRLAMREVDQILGVIRAGTSPYQQ